MKINRSFLRTKIELGIAIRGFSYEEGFKIAKEANFDGVSFLPSYKHGYYVLTGRDIMDRVGN